jgi:hypothetical protein
MAGSRSFQGQDESPFADEGSVATKPQGVMAAHLNLAEEISMLEEVVRQLSRKLTVVLTPEYPSDSESKDPDRATPRESEMSVEVRMSTDRLHELRKQVTDMLNRIDF